MKDTSKLRLRHLSADRPLQRLRGCFLGDNAAVPPAYRVKVQKCASFVDVCKGYRPRAAAHAVYIPVDRPVSRRMDSEAAVDSA